MSFLTQLDWRFAAKDFNPSKKVSDENLQKILDAIRLSPSSFGLQPFHIHVVTNPETKQKIRQNAWNQPQVENCSHLLVFSSRTDILEKRIDDLIEIMSGGNEQVKMNLAVYEELMTGFLGKLDRTQMKSWADRQTYIALGFAMAACAELSVDSCPMEGFFSRRNR
jgi:nitroreductase